MVIIISAIAFFFTVKMTDLADRYAINEYIPIENTEYSVRYSSLEENGICKGSENDPELLIKGTYGYDWGTIAEDGTLYINEYETTDLGFTSSNLVKIDLETLKKEVLYENTLLRGKCVSGELVCMSEYIMDSNRPKTNSLCRLYAMSDSTLTPDNNDAKIIYIDTKSDSIAYSVSDKAARGSGFDDKYINRTLEEVQNES